MGKPSSRGELILYFVCTYALSLLLLLPVYIPGADASIPPWSFLCLVANATPSVVGITFILRTRLCDRKTLLKRSLSFRQIGLRKLLVIVLLFPLVIGLSYVINLLVFKSVPGLSGLATLRSNPATIGNLLFIAFVGPVFEEYGWRGFALEKMQDTQGKFLSSLVVGLLWAVWHLPNPRNVLDVFSLETALFVVNIVSLSVIISYFYLTTGSSILAAIIVHAVHNLSKMLIMPFPVTMQAIYTVILLIASGWIYYLYQNAARTKTQPEGAVGE